MGYRLSLPKARAVIFMPGGLAALVFGGVQHALDAGDGRPVMTTGRNVFNA